MFHWPIQDANPNIGKIIKKRNKVAPASGQMGGVGRTDAAFSVGIEPEASVA
jgi:hypothetical protein